MNPLVSIIFPVYQVSDYVENSLDSVLRQSYKHLECIIVDDSTKDDSIEKCEKIIAGYKGPIQFKIVHHEVNRGLSAARNTGTDTATGDYLYYLDSDDVISPNCIETLVSFINMDDTIEMVQGSYIRVYDNNKEERHQTETIKISNNLEARKQYLKYRNINYTVWNKLLKRTFIIDNQLYNKEGLINEDLLWTFYLIKHLNNACLCNEVTYYYCLRPDSIVNSSTLEKRGSHFVIIYDEILHNLTIGKEQEELNGYLINFCRLLATYKRTVPEFKRILGLYKELAKHYGCRLTILTLSVFGTLCEVCNPYNFLVKLYWLRRKMMK